MSAHVCEHVPGIRMCVYFAYQVIWKRLYKPTSGLDGGTLFQLRNLINRKNVTQDVKKDMNACEDYFQLVTNAHIAAAVLDVMKVVSLSSSEFFFLKNHL